MDNRIFNVNGRGEKALAQAITLALAQEMGMYEGPVTRPKGETLEGFRVDKDKGLILYMYLPTDRKAEASTFLAPMTPAQVAPLVLKWLEEQFKNKTTFKVQCRWDEDSDHDGSNSEGWRCYVEDWGHVADDWGVVCAVVPAWMWHGK